MPSSTSSPRVSHVGIVGSGIMGAGIAEVAVTTGHRATVRSRSESAAREVVDRVAKSLAKRVERGKLEAAQRDEALALLATTTNLVDLATCDLVIESVIEDIDAKRAILAELDSVLADSAVIATNTSTLSVTELALSTKQIGRAHV